MDIQLVSIKLFCNWNWRWSFAKMVEFEVKVFLVKIAIHCVRCGLQWFFNGVLAKFGLFSQFIAKKIEKVYWIFWKYRKLTSKKINFVLQIMNVIFNSSPNWVLNFLNLNLIQKKSDHFQFIIPDYFCTCSYYCSTLLAW